MRVSNRNNYAIYSGLIFELKILSSKLQHCSRGSEKLNFVTVVNDLPRDKLTTVLILILRWELIISDLPMSWIHENSWK